jgi:hypothetical protein
MDRPFKILQVNTRSMILKRPCFRTQAGRHGHKALRRRSQRTRLNWTRMNRITTRWLPSARPRHGGFKG